MLDGRPIPGQPSYDQRLIRRQQLIAEIRDGDVIGLGDRLSDLVQHMLAGHIVTRARRYTFSRLRRSITSRNRDNDATAMNTGCR